MATRDWLASTSGTRVVLPAPGGATRTAVFFALSAARLVYRGLLLALGLAAIGYTVYSGGWRSAGKRFPPIGLVWRGVFFAVFAAFTVYGFINALAPERLGSS